MFNEMVLLVRNFLKSGYGDHNFNTYRICTPEIVRPFGAYDNAIETSLIPSSWNVSAFH
jgi:hypothetical protein